MRFLQKKLPIPSNRLLLLSAVICTTPVLSQPLLAQTAENRAAPMIEEVVVTGQKREENLQEVPISASAFSADDIRNKSITNVEDLQYLTPALSIQEQGGVKLINIRGVGLATVSPQTTSGVAYHIDGFFVPNEIALSETYFDLDGIEIFRGPQGTFVGQNSTGGAMFIRSARPEYGRSGFNLTTGVGSYNQRRLEGAVDIPVSERLAVRIAGTYESRDGFYDNIGPTGDDPGDVDRQGLRASVRYQASDNVEVSFKHEMTRSESGGAFQKDLTDGIADNFTVAYGYPTTLDLDVDRSTLDVSWDLSDTLQLRSITVYQDVAQLRYEDADSTLAQIQDRWIEITEKTVQQELNLISSFGGNFEFVTGAFYLKDESFFYSEDYIPSRLPGRAYEITEGKPAHESWSVYAEGNFQLSDNLELVAGFRYIDDTVSDDDGGYTCRRCTSPATLTTQGRLIAESANTTVTTGRLVLNWQVDPDHMLYGSISRGFKSGGFNPGRYGFDPEYVLSYEMGHKSTFADGLVRFNSSAYIYDYEGYQLRIYDPNTAAGSSLLNTTDTKIYGLESELTVLQGNWLANVAVGYGKSELQDLSLPDPRNPPPTGPFIDLDGTPLSYHPEFTVSAGLAYETAFRGGDLRASLRYSYTDEQWTQIYQVDPVDYLDAYGLAHFDVTYRSAGDWWVKAFVSNLTDKEYISGKQLNRALRDVEYYGAPRMVGIEFGWSTF